MKNIINWTRLTIITSVTAFALGLGGTAYAQNEGTAKGGGMKLMQAKPLKRDSAAVKSGDIVLSTCPTCKTTSYKHIDTAKGGGAALTQAGKGECPACEGKASGAGEPKHTCKKCGSEMICTVIPGKETAEHKH